MAPYLFSRMRSSVKTTNSLGPISKAAYHRRYRLAHKAERNARAKQYYQAHKAERYAYRQQRKAEIAAYDRQYRQTKTGKDIRLKCRHKWRALKANATIENFTPLEIFVRDKYICQMCGRKTRPDYKTPYHPLYPNLDHIIPLNKGGDHSRQNTQCLCRQCNATKHDNATGNQLRLW